MAPRKTRPKHEIKDRISSLSDKLLQEIISLLPTETAVSTSVLSKRWQHIWTGISNIHFSFREGDQRMYKIFNDSSRFHQWFTSFPNYHFRKIYLEFQVFKCPVFPTTLLTCESLTIKCLGHDSAVSFLCLSDLLIPDALSNTVLLPKLKVLHLEYVNICCEEQMGNIHIYLPDLEDLHLTQCPLVYIEMAIITAHNLKNLEIDVTDNSPSNNSSSSECELQIWAKNLRTLTVDNTDIMQLYKLTLKDTSLLEEAFIGLGFGMFYYPGSWLHVFDMIRGVVHLTLTRSTIAIADRIFLEKLLHFPNLRSFTVVWSFALLNGSMLTNLFRYLPNIETLIFDCAIDPNEFQTQGLTLQTVAQPFISNLKSVKLNGMYGNMNGLGFIQFLLINAVNLQNVTITTSSDYDLDSEEASEFIQRVQMLPRTSTELKIDFTSLRIHKSISSSIDKRFALFLDKLKKNEGLLGRRWR